jgi:hypothetical protein
MVLLRDFRDHDSRAAEWLALHQKVSEVGTQVQYSRAAPDIVLWIHDPMSVV